MMNDKDKTTFEKMMIDFHVKFIHDILEKHIDKKPDRKDIDRIKMIPVPERQHTYLISIDDIYVGRLEGRFDTIEQQVRYQCDFIPTEAYNYKP